ncbi:MAG TPA: HAD-IIB family hydrolase [Bryobacteraceae bacterium]|nr:HAD-IIB family hydrolase [Bryobacteraceae bacterium]HPT25404.1 HAD-IIB family hydrolase [Bryobacteraceae bacterium]
MIAVFTDLDGCLLDHSTYEWQPALPALRLLERYHAPVIFTTSKTHAEVGYWQSVIGIRHPAIVENGGAILLPPQALPAWPPDSEQLDGGMARIVMGWPHMQVVQALHRAAAESRCDVRGFSEMSDEEIAVHCNMSLEQAALAAQREYSEPFLLLTPRREPNLLRAFLAHGLKLTRGGRFYHAQRHAGKHQAVRRLIDLYSEFHAPVVTIGLGDALNDEGMLGAVDYPIILRSAHSEELRRRLPNARATAEAGPAAWSQSLLTLLGEIENDIGPAA